MDSDVDSLLAMLEYLEDDMKYKKIKYFEPDGWQQAIIEKSKNEKVRGVICGNR